MAVYGYCRVSTVRAAEAGESLGAQERALRGYAMMHGLVLDHVYIERGVSGSVPLGERPEGAKLMAALKRGDVTLTPKLDRCFRSALDALDVLDRLKNQGVSLHMLDLGGDVTSNGISKLVFTILSAVAEAERDRIRERISDVKRDQRTRGRFLGGTVPFGWQIGVSGHLAAVPAQQEAISAIWKLRAAGASLRGIAETMQAQGHSLTHMSVRRILRDTPAQEGS
jgi:putative DNA-invertase from lambdoid prophage Rac